MLNLAQAIAIAAEAHVHQADKQGKPYVLHCLHVMRGVKRYNDEELSIIAVLHDLVKDTKWELNVPIGENAPYYIYISTVKSVQISKRVHGALYLLTHIKGISYTQYINFICTNQDAIKVKMADLQHNSQIFRLKGIALKDIKRMVKYHEAYTTLKNP